MDAIYLDYAATSPLRPEVARAMRTVQEERFGNPSSVHTWGREARAALEDARARLAAVIAASPAEIVFTRGGTEADNLAILGRARSAPSRAVVCSAIEHKAVLAAAHAAEAEGARIHILPADSNGVVRADALEAVLADRPAVVSVMWANNETGSVQPVSRLAGICREAGVVFHTDAVQAFGKIPVQVDEVPVDLLSITAHKLGGPRGTGALYVRRGTDVAPLIHGGSQEHGLRPGTEDVAGAVGFAVAAELAAADREAEMRRLGSLRDRLETGLRESIPDLVVNGIGCVRLPTILNVSVPGADGSALLMALDMEGIAASSGSACSSGAVEPSHVLTAMGVPVDVAIGSVRFSLGPETTGHDIDRVIEVFPGLVERIRALSAA